MEKLCADGGDTMNPIAVYTGELMLYWSAIIIAFGIAAGFAMSQALYTS